MTPINTISRRVLPTKSFPLTQQVNGSNLSRDKKHNFKSLEDVFGDFKLRPSEKRQSNRFQKLSEDTFDFLALIEKWPQIIGERVSKYTIPLKNKDKVLTILSNHPAFSQQLSLMEEVVKKKIIDEFPSLQGKIKRINFITNGQFFEKQKNFRDNQISKKVISKDLKKTIHPFDPRFKALKSKAEEYFSDVKDDDVKQTLISLYIQSNCEKN